MLGATVPCPEAFQTKVYAFTLFPAANVSAMRTTSATMSFSFTFLNTFP
jgi:hypothetical protein